MNDNSSNNNEPTNSELDPFNVNGNNNVANALPEEISENTEINSNPVETFDILNKTQGQEDQTASEQSFIPANYDDQDIAPQDMTIQNNNSNIETNIEPVNNYNPNVTEIKDDNEVDHNLISQLSMVYIGANSEKFNKIPNFAAFIFTFLYAFYRKMYLLGIVLIILEVLISLLLKNTLFTLIINVAMLFGFNVLYILHVKRKVTRISKRNKDKPIGDINNICAISGGTSIGMVFVSIMISIFLGLVIGLAFSILGIAKDFLGADINSIKDVPKVIRDFSKSFKEEYFDFGNNKYMGVAVANYDEDLPKSFTVTVPYVFTNNTTTLHTYSYEYYQKGVEEPTCIFSLYQAKGFEDGEALINKIMEYDSKHGFETSPKEEVVINNIKFINIVSKDDKSDIYYYGTTKNNKAYLAEYIVSHENDDCVSYKDKVINSIKEVN